MLKSSQDFGRELSKQENIQANQLVTWHKNLHSSGRPIKLWISNTLHCMRKISRFCSTLLNIWL